VRLVFHLTTRDAWEEALVRGRYTADSLASEGFIHCSDADQFVWVANTRFRGRTDLILLHISEARLDAAVRRENLEGGDALFPHIYGPLTVEAVVGVSAFPPSTDGRFDHLAVLATQFIQKSIDTLHRHE